MCRLIVSLKEEKKKKKAEHGGGVLSFQPVKLRPRKFWLNSRALEVSGASRVGRRDAARQVFSPAGESLATQCQFAPQRGFKSAVCKKFD